MISPREMAIAQLADLLSPVREQLRLVEARISEAVQTEQPELTAAYRSLLAGGKRLRPALTLLAAGPDGAAKAEVIALGAALEMLHAATLIHDDVVDAAPVRRGQPTIYARQGADVAILAGDHLFARAAVVVTETQSFEALRVFAQTLVTISDGELRQVWRNSHLPDMDEYLRLIYAKTACLFESAALGGALLAGLPRTHVERFARYGRDLGLAFQIADDALDYSGNPDVMGKPAQNDLERGLLTLPALLCLWDGGHDGRSLDLSSKSERQRLVQSVLAGGFHRQALERARAYAEQAWESIAGIVEGAYAESLRGLAGFATARTS